MTTHRQIVEHWRSMHEDGGLTVDWGDAQERCWRCGNKANLQRCHIVPASLGGADEPANLVLLCARCHREAPNVSDQEFMWQWLRAHAAPLYGIYWSERASREFEFVFKRPAFSLLDASTRNVNSEQISAAVAEQMAKTSMHFGDGSLNISTLVWVFAKVEAHFVNQASNSLS
jgi:hypothetical protein